VQAVLAARIDRQDDLAKRTLQAAAIIGAEFPVAVVEEVTGLPQRDVGAALHTLAAADLIYQIAAYPEVEHAFKHPLTQAVAYDTQLGEARRRLHGTSSSSTRSRASSRTTGSRRASRSKPRAGTRGQRAGSRPTISTRRCGTGVPRVRC
jgi:hypothetical protein